MNDFSAIDGFLDTFIRYIDSGFGLISGDVTSLAAILIAIDVTLAALFWAWGSNTDIIQSLVKKTLYVGAFAFIFGNFAMLSTIVLDSFATLGLNASAATLSPADLMRPGLVAAEGLAASAPIFDHIGDIAPGPLEFFANISEIKEPDKGGKGSDGGEDDLRGSDLKELFYRYLIHLPKDRQIIIIENTDPPVDVQTMEQVTHFSGAKGVGRPGFFPIE